MKTEDLVLYIEEIYKTGLRSISMLTDILNESKDDIINNLTDSIQQDKVKKSQNRQYLMEARVDDSLIRKKVSEFIQMMNLYSCLGMFGKIVDAVGMKGFAEEFNNVASRIDTPAAKVISFSINSYYNNTDPREIKKIAAELKDHPVAYRLLQARVLAHLNTNYVSYRDRQSIASSLQLKLRPQPKRIK